MAEANCSACMFYEANNPKVGGGVCRRMPPQFVPHHPTIGSPVYKPKWPEVGMGEWCGEFAYAGSKLHPFHGKRP